jgi:hypothetical protein
LLVAIIVMAYVLSLQAAFEQATHKLKTYGDGKKSLSISLFRQRLTKLRYHVQSLSVFIDYLSRITQTLYTAK